MSAAEFPPKLQQDAEYLREEGYDVELEREGNNVYALFHEFQLPEGKYNKETVTILQPVPIPYPEGEMEMFWTDVDIRTASGQVPEKATVTNTYLGEEWRRFSWHRQKEWDPATDDLIDQASFIEQRFVEHD